VAIIIRRVISTWIPSRYGWFSEGLRAIINLKNVEPLMQNALIHWSSQFTVLSFDQKRREGGNLGGSLILNGLNAVER